MSLMHGANMKITCLQLSDLFLYTSTTATFPLIYVMLARYNFRDSHHCQTYNC